VAWSNDQGMVTSRIVRPTDLLFPFDDSPEPDPVAEAEAAALEQDWSFDDAELTMQLRAVKQGRGWTIAIIAGTILAMAAAISLVL
jgi:hypothetical protein